MTLSELHSAIQEHLYIEDFGMVDIIMASIIANSLKLGDPIWLTLIGPSSGGKSQLIRPLHKANSKLIHRIDDLTPNTLISGTLGMQDSLLGRIGAVGILSMDDLTVLFSKNAEQRAEILSQFRMLYDGRFSKSSGNRKEPMIWEGYLGMISGSTPSIYRYFNEVADMGERFVSYRMRPIDKHKAVEFIMAHNTTAHDLDATLSDIYKTFITDTIQEIGSTPHTTLTDNTKHRIADIAEHCTLLRTPVHIDERSGLVDEFPEPEMPFRVMKQLTAIAKGLQALTNSDEDLPETLLTALEWVAYSLANEKRRAYLRAIVGLTDAGKQITARNLSAMTGLHVSVCEKGMDQLQALGIVSLTEDGTTRRWKIENTNMSRISRRLDPVDSGTVEATIDF